jgi:hypothetical protein
MQLQWQDRASGMLLAGVKIRVEEVLPIDEAQLFAVRWSPIPCKRLLKCLSTFLYTLNGAARATL